MLTFAAASGSFQVKSSFTSLVRVFVTVRFLPFFLIVTLKRSCTLMVSILRARSYSDQRYWSMQSCARRHSSVGSGAVTLGGLTFGSDGVTAASLKAGSASAASG